MGALSQTAQETSEETRNHERHKGSGNIIV